MTWVEAAKRAAVSKALEEIQDAGVIGVGSGTTLGLLVPELAKLIRRKRMELKLIPTSNEIERVIAEYGLAASSPNDVSGIDLALDGADQAESGSLDLIKGGGAALTREKIVDSAAKRLIIVVDETKLTDKLGRGQVLPVEVIPFAHRFVAERLAELGGKPELRCKGSSPITTDNGNFVIDADFGPIDDASLLEGRLKSISGLVETGLFLGMADRVYVGMSDGAVKVLEPS